MSKQMIRWVVMALVVGLACALQSSAGAKGLDSPTVTGISPAAAEPGKTVTITGASLIGATVTFHHGRAGTPGVTATQAETIIDPTGNRILLTIPDGSDAANGMMAPIGVDRLIITAPSGSVAAAFTVLPLRETGHAPVITAISPRSASPGQTVTITGGHLSGATGVWLTGHKAKFKAPSDSKIVAIVPMHATSGEWTVKTPVGMKSSPLRFTVKAR
jgi:hypothetical protein